MSGLERRLERVAETLTAKERALLVLGALKEERPVDVAWRRTMPEHQAEEFDRYVTKISGLNVKLGSYILALHKEVEKLELRLESIVTLLRSGLAAWQTRFFLMRETKEQVTESEYSELQAEARAELMLASELAELLVEEGRGQEAARDEAWERLRGEKQRELAGLVEQGVLAGSEQGGGLFVEAGPFFDWLGEPVPLQPAWALEYEVLADEEVEQVRRRRAERALVRKLAREAPMQETARLLGWVEEFVELAEQTPRDDLLERHVRLVRAGMAERRRQFGAVDLMVEEVRRELEGEDPLLPDRRELLEQSRKTLDQCRRAEAFIGPLALEEPREGDLAHQRGYTDLTYKQLDSGFKSVASGLGLPTRLATWLREKHERTALLVKAYETMAYALMEAIEDWEALKEEHAQPTPSEAYKIVVANNEAKRREEVFDYAERIAEKDIELERLKAGDGGWRSAPGVIVTEETMQKAVDTLLAQFSAGMQQRLGGTDLNDAASRRFGHDNIRPNIDVVDGENRPVTEEDELFEDAAEEDT